MATAWAAEGQGTVYAARTPDTITLAGDLVDVRVVGADAFAILVRDGDRWRADRVVGGEVHGGRPHLGDRAVLGEEGALQVWRGETCLRPEESDVSCTPEQAAQGDVPVWEVLDDVGSTSWRWKGHEVILDCADPGAVAPSPDGGWVVMNACGGLARFEQGWRASGHLTQLTRLQGPLQGLSDAETVGWWSMSEQDAGLVLVDADDLAPWSRTTLRLPLGEMMPVPGPARPREVRPRLLAKVALPEAADVRHALWSAPTWVLAGTTRRADGTSRSAVWVVRVPMARRDRP
jgi:hypothetical protein